MVKVGILSGTFDPIHNGHLQFAHDALEQAGLDKVFFLPEARPRRKQGVKAIEHRLNMVHLAVMEEPQFGVIVLGQDRFTPQETLPVLKARFQGASLHMLMGDDMLKHLGDWPHVEQVIGAVHFIIGVRSDQNKAIGLLQAIEKTRGVDMRYQIFQSTLPSVSSSRIKSVLRKKNKSNKIPLEVQAYIKRHGLYSPTEVVS